MTVQEGTARPSVIVSIPLDRPREDTVFFTSFMKFLKVSQTEKFVFSQGEEVEKVLENLCYLFKVARCLDFDRVYCWIYPWGEHVESETVKFILYCTD